MNTTHSHVNNISLCVCVCTCVNGNDHDDNDEDVYNCPNSIVIVKVEYETNTYTVCV